MAAERLGQLGSWTFEVATGDLWCSVHLRELFDIDAAHEPTEGPSRFLARLAPPERRRLVGAVERCRSTGVPFSVACSLVRNDGERRSLVVQGERARHDPEEPVVLWGIVQDITEFTRPSGHTSSSFQR